MTPVKSMKPNIAPLNLTQFQHEDELMPLCSAQWEPYQLHRDPDGNQVTPAATRPQVSEQVCNDISDLRVSSVIQM